MFPFCNPDNSVNLGAYPDHEDAAYEMLARKMAETNNKKTGKQVSKEAKELKKKALSLRLEKLSEYRGGITIYGSEGNSFQVQTSKNKPDNQLYTLEIKRPVRNTISVLSVNKHIILPVKRLVYSGQLWLEYYEAFVRDTNAIHFTIITDEGIFKVRKSFLVSNSTGKSVSRNFDTPRVISLSVLKQWKSDSSHNDDDMRYSLIDDCCE